MRAAVGRTGSRGRGRFIAALTILAAFGCGRKVMVPPRLDLAPHRPVGLVTFTIENAKGALNVVATERFGADVFAGQSDVELLELGELDDALARIGMDRMDPEAASAIGEAFDVPAVFVGHLIVSDAKPRASLARVPQHQCHGGRGDDGPVVRDCIGRNDLEQHRTHHGDDRGGRARQRGPVLLSRGSRRGLWCDG